MFYRTGNRHFRLISNYIRLRVAGTVSRHLHERFPFVRTKIENHRPCTVIDRGLEASEDVRRSTRSFRRRRYHREYVSVLRTFVCQGSHLARGKYRAVENHDSAYHGNTTVILAHRTYPVFIEIDYHRTDYDLTLSGSIKIVQWLEKRSASNGNGSSSVRLCSLRRELPSFLVVSSFQFELARVLGKAGHTFASTRTRYM